MLKSHVNLFSYIINIISYKLELFVKQTWTEANGMDIQKNKLFQLPNSSQLENVKS